MFYKLIHCALAISLLAVGSLYSQDKTVLTFIAPPHGYIRTPCDSGSFGHWLQRLPLKADKVIRSYDGDTVRSGFYNVWGVVDMPLMFTSDIEQCADYCMRLWAEYHRAHNAFDKLYLFNYNGTKNYFNNSNRTFRSFCKQAFAYSNSHSLKKGCATVADTALAPGDLLIQNETGGIGHFMVASINCLDAMGRGASGSGERASKISSGSSE